MNKTLRFGSRMAAVAMLLAIPAMGESTRAAPTTAAQNAAPASATTLAQFTGYWERGSPPPGAGGPPPGASGPPPGAPASAPAGYNAAKTTFGTIDEPGRFPPNLVRVLKPWAQKALDAYKAEIRAGKEPPTPENECLPFALPGERIAYGFTFLIVATPAVVLIANDSDHQMRLITMNGTHPTKLAPSWYGHSIGHWEGDTLVIDTIGFNDKSQLADGIPHTDQLHAVERYRLSDGGKTLNADYFYEDPGSMTGPFEFSSRFVHSSPMQEYVTAQNNVEYQCPENKDWRAGLLDRKLK